MGRQLDRYELVEEGGPYNSYSSLQRKRELDRYETWADDDFWCSADGVAKLEDQLKAALELLREIEPWMVTFENEPDDYEERREQLLKDNPLD